MATLIQSKQIQGVVTASVIQGEFSVQSGSVNLSGATGVTGSFTGSFIGDGSQLTFGGTGLVSGSSQVNADSITNFDSNVKDKMNSDGVISGSTQLEGEFLQINGDSVVSSSAQISGYNTFLEINGDGVVSGSSQINTLFVGTAVSTSLDSRLVSLENATDNTGSDSQTLSISGDQLTISSGNTITIPTGSGGASSWNELSDIPSGLISGSTFTNFSSSVDLRIVGISASGSGADWNINLQNIPSGLVSGSVLRTLDGTGVLSGSIVDQLPSGVISGSSQLPSGLVSSSVQITDGSGIVSGSVLRTLDGTTVLSGSIVDQLPSGIISGSTFTSFSSSVDSRLDTLENATDNTGSDTQSLSISGDQLTISDGNTVTIPTGSGGSVPAGTISGSAQITAFGFTSGSHTDIPSGTISSSEQVISSLPSGVISGSTQITDGSGLISGSVLRTLDGTGVVSGSVLRTLDSTGIFSGSLVAGNNITINQVGDNFEISSSASGGGSVPSGTVSSSVQTITHLDGTNIFSGSIIGQGSITITSGSGNITISGSGGSSDITYDGNRVISNEDLGDLFTNSVNPGTSGSIQDFLNAVFYPNTGPSISTGNQTILEYVSSGSSIVTLSGTDPEGQAITFGTASSYTDDLVRVESGVLKLNALAESSSFNTDSVGGSHGHQVTVTATDTFGTVTEKDIYVIVTPNEAPKFRQTSVGGSVITSFTANLNENSTNGTVAGTIYFTDEESDTITISSSSIDNNHFVINKYATYVQIVQNTGSLDYEQQTSYSFSISASDEHYEAGQDSDSITTLPITINVTDNQIPVVNNQTLSSINENSSNGATVDSIAASDNEGDTITFVNFNLHKLLLDGVEVSSGSYGGTSQLTDPHENPFQMSSTGVVTRKNGVYLNSDLINSYQYRVQVKDDFNTSSPASIITIPITDDTPATLSDNWSAGPYIKESEVSSTTIKTTNYGSTQADYNSNQSGTWSSSNSAISINSNGNLSLGVDLSGSVTQSGDTLDSTITFTNSFGTTTTDNLSVTIVANDAPIATFTNQSSNFNTNLATDGTTMVSMSITDTEGDTPYSVSLSGTNASDLQLKYTNVASSSVGIQSNGNLSAGTYNYDVVVTDSYSESTTYSGRSFTIASASTGTLSTNGTLYVIESATNGDSIVLNSNGRTGTQGSVSVSYSPNYGSQSAGSFTSSNGLISINSSTGVLSVGTDISGSGNVNGDTITSTIGWTDQYGNVGSDTITVNVAKNNAPSVLSTQTFNTNTNQATGSSEIVRLNLSDTEGDTIPNSSLSFTNYNSTYFTPSISTPQMKLLVNSTSIPAGSYPYTASIEDEHGFETRVHSGSVTIVQSGTGTLEDDTAIYIIESALSGSVFRDQTGFGLGSPAQVTVSYSPSYGSQVVQSFTSSNEAIVIDSNGNLTLGLDISGSVTQSGDTFTSTITFDDQYGNVGSGSVTATVFGNSSPAASFTATSEYNTDGATSGSTAGTLTVTDTENNSPFTITLAGTDGGKFDVSGSSSPFTIQPTGSLDAALYSINITVTDSYGESVTLTGESITVSAANDYGKVYIYTSTRTGGGTLSDGNYDGLMGITSENTSFEPDLITGYQSIGPSPIYEFKTGELGTSSITVGGGTMTLRNTVSGSNLDTIISSSFNGNGSTAEQIMIIFPSGSDMDGIPTSMTDSLGGSTSGEYVLYLKAAGESSFTAAGSQIHMFDVDSAVEGYTRWNIIGRNSVNTAASFEVRLIPSSGSAP